MCWHSPFSVGTLPFLMRRWILSTTGLLTLVLACPCVAQAQAEEAPPETVDSLPAPAQATATSMPAPLAPAETPSPQISPSAAIARDHAWVLIPYFGLNLPVAAAANSYSAGFRLGGLAGWHATPRFSINGEFTLDLMDGDTDASILRPHEHYLDVVLSPLFHFRSGRIVFGPKLGWFTNNRSFSDSDPVPARDCMTTTGSRTGACSMPILEAHTGQGFLFGLNAGGFMPLGRVAIGLLASANFRHFTTVDCGPYGCAGDYSLVTIMSLSLVALF